MRITTKCILVILVYFLTLKPAEGKKIYVPTDSLTIQSAINGAVNGDTVFVEAGTHSGAGNYNLAINGKDIIIMGENAGTTIISLSGGQNGFFLDFTQEDNNTIIQDLSIQTGNTAIILHESAPLIKNVRLINNGRGIYLSNPFGLLNCINSYFSGNDTGIVSYAWSETSFNIDTCTFVDNNYGAYGTFTITSSEISGGDEGLGCDDNEFNPGSRFIADSCDINNQTIRSINVGSNCEISNSKVQNSREIAYGISPSGRYNRLYLDNCQIDNNQLGISVLGYNSTLTMDNCRYTENDSLIHYSTNGTGQLRISNCIIYGNDKSGIDAYSVSPSIRIDHNIIGGGSYVTDGIMIASGGVDVEIYSNTIFDVMGNGIYIGDVTGGAYIDSNIVMDCDSYGIYFSGLASDTSISCNDTYNNYMGNYGGGLPDLTGQDGNISVDPEFCDVSYGDFHVQATSPCLPGNNSCGITIGRNGSGCETLRPLIVTAYSTVGLMGGNSVNIAVIDPDGYAIGKDWFGTLHQTLYPASYTEVSDIDQIVINYPIEGTYTIQVVRTYDIPFARAAMYSIGIRIDGTEEASTVVDADVPDGPSPDEYEYVVEEGWHYMNGDANRDEMLNILDIVYVINCLYKGGPLPYPVVAAEANCNMELNILDIVYMINYLYKNGPEPCPIPGY